MHNPARDIHFLLAQELLTNGMQCLLLSIEYLLYSLESDLLVILAVISL